MEILSEHLSRVEQISMRLRDISAYHSVMSPYAPNYVKMEDDRMHDVMTSSTRASFSNAYPRSPGSVVPPLYPDPASPTDAYWSSGQSDSGRSKYKKRSVFHLC